MSSGVHFLEFGVRTFINHTGIEIDDDEAEKIFTPSEAVELLKVKLEVH